MPPHETNVGPGDPVKKVYLLTFLAIVILGPASGYAGQVASAPQIASSPGDVTYKLQSGDEIEIKVFEIPELADRVRIRPDGKVSVLLLDDVQAAGLTPAELDQVLTTGYSTYYLNPRVTVIVRAFSSQRVYVGGEVNEPGMLQLSGELSLLGAVWRRAGSCRARSDPASFC